MIPNRITNRDSARIKNFLGGLVASIARRHAKPNPTLAKAPKVREETRYYTKADLFRRWLKRGERRTREGEAAGLILDMPKPVARVLDTIQETHGRLFDIEQRQRVVFEALSFELPEPEPTVETAA